jgi:hypothetical protein
MAAGLGFKDFLAGSVLTAADTNGYMASQANMVFATAAARDTAITSPQEGMIAVLKDSDSVFMYNGTAWVQDSGIAAYTSFTPTLGGWTLGDGVFLSYFKVTGKMVHYYGKFTFGSTSAVGASGGFTVTLPETSRFGDATRQIGIVNFRDASAAINVSGHTQMESTTVMSARWLQIAAATDYTRRINWDTGVTPPFVYTSGDQVTWDVVYERA